MEGILLVQLQSVDPICIHTHVHDNTADMQGGHCETTLHPRFVLCILVLPFYNMIVPMPPFPRSYGGDSTVTLLRGIICICRGLSCLVNRAFHM